MCEQNGVRLERCFPGSIACVAGTQEKCVGFLLAVILGGQNEDTINDY